MKYKDLNIGYVVEYKFKKVETTENEDGTFIEETTINYAKTPVYKNTKDLNEKLADLDKREDLIDYHVTQVKYKRPQ